MKHFHENHFYSWAIFMERRQKWKLIIIRTSYTNMMTLQIFKIFYVYRKCTIQVFCHFQYTKFILKAIRIFSNGINIKSFIHQKKWSKSEFSEALFRIIGLHFCFSIDLLWKFGNSWFTKWTIFNFMIIYLRIYPPLLDNHGYYVCRVSSAC